MSRSVVWDIKEAFLWTDFGIEFAKRHFTEEQIAKIWGGNLLRVMERVEEHAAREKKKHK